MNTKDPEKYRNIEREFEMIKEDHKNGQFSWLIALTLFVVSAIHKLRYCS